MSKMTDKRELEIKLSKYGQFPRHELVSMGLVSPSTIQKETNGKKI